MCVSPQKKTHLHVLKRMARPTLFSSVGENCKIIAERTINTQHSCHIYLFYEVPDEIFQTQAICHRFYHHAYYEVFHRKTG